MGPLATPILIVKSVWKVNSVPKFKGEAFFFALHNLIIEELRDFFS